MGVSACMRISSPAASKLNRKHVKHFSMVFLCDLIAPEQERTARTKELSATEMNDNTSSQPQHCHLLWACSKG